jgi:hypothetical protein
MGLARKYILECECGFPSGLTYVTIKEQYNLLNSFSGTTDVGVGRDFSYSGITEEQLINLSDSAYNQRVSDFIVFVGIGKLGSSQRYQLFTGSTFNDVTCSGTTT